MRKATGLRTAHPDLRCVAVQSCRQRELRLVQSQRFIADPSLDTFDITPVPLP